MECRSGDLGCCDYYYFVLPVAHKHICTQLTVDLQWKCSNHLSLTYGIIYIRACGGTVGSGPALQAERSWVQFPMVSLEYFIDIILPAALWPWGRSRL